MKYQSIWIFLCSLDLIIYATGDSSQIALDRALNIVRNNNVTVITIGYVAGMAHRPGSWTTHYKRSGRYISGALTYAIHKLNTMAYNKDRESLLPTNYQLNVQFIETFGEKTMSIQAVANMSVENKIWAIFGPQDTCQTEANIAAAYNILMMSHFCTDNILAEEPKTYSTFIRTSPQSSGLAESLVSFLQKFNWNHVALVGSNDKENQFIFEDCVTVLRKNNINILHRETFTSPAIYGASMSDIPDIIERTYQTCRIYVFVGADYESVCMLMALYQKNLTYTGEYFVISVMLRDDSISKAIISKVQEILPSMRNFVIISHIKPEGELVNEHRNKFKQFMNLPPFNVRSEIDNYSYDPVESSYLYDAVWLYAGAVGTILRNQTIGSPKNGTLLKQLLLNKSYTSVFGYMNRLDDQGGALGNYTVTQIVFDSTFSWQKESVGLFKSHDNNALEFKFLPDKNINWIRNIPRDVPECGFKDELCKTNDKIILISVGLCIVLIVVILVSAFIIRSNKYEKELERLLWKIDKNKEIDLNNSELLEKYFFINRPPIKENENGTVYISVDEDKDKFLITISCCNVDMLSPSDWSNSNSLMGIYRNQEVVIKRVFFSSALSITRKVKKELKILREMSDMNLNKFLGAIIEHNDTWVVWEFCDRGSLQDVLYSTNLTKDYPVFLSSFAFDVIRGLTFLHDNPNICFHGHLKSSNCLVDGRWTVKLTDYGMTEFLTYMLPPPDMPEYRYFMSLFWTAPEILRNMIQSKCQNNHFLHDFKRNFMSGKKRSMDNMSEEYFSDLVNDDSCRDTFIKNSFPPMLKNIDTYTYQKGDIYSFSMIFYELHSCQIPFLSNYCSQNSPKEIIRRVMVLNDQFKVPYRPKLSLLSRTDEKQIELIKSCWQENCNQRPAAKAIYNRLKVILGDKKNLVECMKEKMILYTKNLEKEVMKRTEELREEKKQNEELLYQMLPIPVAEQLRQHKQVEAEAFDCVSIYFSDIVGFTELSGSCSPFEVVNLLNRLYTSFDTIIDNFNVYKVETIGDSYMVVSGLPTLFDKHAREMACMSLRLLEEITKGFSIPSKNCEKESLKLRIGLHSGPCCAGVVGTRNPRYCLFGDTVNMASRMESTGEALKIHCSEAFVQQIINLNEFHITERGLIEVKGKGYVNTFWLLGKSNPNTSTPTTPSSNIVKSTSCNFTEYLPECRHSEKSLKGRYLNNFFDKRKDSECKKNSSGRYNHENSTMNKVYGRIK